MLCRCQGVASPAGNEALVTDRPVTCPGHEALGNVSRLPTSTLVSYPHSAAPEKLEIQFNHLLGNSPVAGGDGAFSHPSMEGAVEVQDACVGSVRAA